MVRTVFKSPGKMRNHLTVLESPGKTWTSRKLLENRENTRVLVCVCVSVRPRPRACHATTVVGCFHPDVLQGSA